MYGSGVESVNTKHLINKMNVADCVNLCGNRPNEDIINIMRSHHIFLFTSDRNEGWGAVANEAMSNGCAVIASGAIGSVPFLINNGVNGLIFKDQDVNDLLNKTMLLINRPDLRADLVRKAYSTMHDVWSPRNAAKSFIKLAESALDNNIKVPEVGPCSFSF